MQSQRRTWMMAMACAAVLATAMPRAQFSTVPPDDVSALGRRVDEARAALATARTKSGADASELSRLDTELSDLDEEIVYLKVKARRGERVSDSDRRDLATRLTRVEERLAGAAASTGSATEIPVGTEMDVRLQTPLSSKDAKVEQRVDATTVVPLARQGRTLVAAGAAVRGHVAAVEPATRLDRRGRIVITFTRLTASGDTHDVTLSITQALESEGIRGEAGRIGVGAGVGAVLGGILNGVKGAIAGILIGGGGAVLATEGKDVELPVGTILRVRFDAPLELGS